MAAEVTAPTPTTDCTALDAALPQKRGSSRGQLSGDRNDRTAPSDPSASHAEEDEGASSASRPTTASPVTSPPYWTHGQAHMLPAGGASSRNSNNPKPGASSAGAGAGRDHLRSGVVGYNNSSESVLSPGAITLQDNETGPGDGDGPDRVSGRDRNRACWAKSVSVTDYVIVNGSATNIGAFVVWNIRVETLSGSYMNIRKRYSEFDDLREKLIMTFPNFEAAVPTLPPKSVISKFRPRFLEKRRSGLQYFLNCILLNPEFSGSPVLKDFLFS